MTGRLSPIGTGARIGGCAAVFSSWLGPPRSVTWSGCGHDSFAGAPPTKRPRAALAGDELLESVNTQSTMASTIDTPPEQIFPWLAQMGCDRAGWYSWDWLDNAQRRSEEQIIPEWQDLAEGDRLTSTPNGSAYLAATVVDPPHALVLRGSDPDRSAVRPTRDRPPRLHSVNVGVRTPRVGRRRHSLVVRTRSTSRPEWPQRILNTAFWEPAHAVMQRRQFANLHRRCVDPRGQD